MLGGLAGIYYELGQLGQSRAHYERALAGQMRAFGPRRPNVANLLANIANVCDDLGDHAGAVGYSERAIAIVDATAPDSPEAAQMRLNLADLSAQPRPARPRAPTPRRDGGAAAAAARADPRAGR